MIAFPLPGLHFGYRNEIGHSKPFTKELATPILVQGIHSSVKKQIRRLIW